MLEALQKEFGIPGAVGFAPGRNGLPTVVLSHPSGAGAVAYLHGAHVASWTAPGSEELLFLSRKSSFEPGRPIRGGIPVIFPQFGPGALPQHGFARISPWRLLRTGSTTAGVSAVLVLEQSPETLAMWPHAFRLELTVLLEPAALGLALRVGNPGEGPFQFTTAFHTYFGVADIRQTAVLDLKGVTTIDSLRDDVREVETRDAVRFDQETDRIYIDAPDRVRIADEGSDRQITIEKGGMPDIVVWNPWVAKSQRMVDFGDDEYLRMVCVETGVIDRPAALAPGAAWQGTTVLRVDAPWRGL